MERGSPRELPPPRSDGSRSQAPPHGRSPRYQPFDLPVNSRQATGRIRPRLALRDTLPQHAGVRLRSGIDEPAAPLAPWTRRGTQRFLGGLGLGVTVENGYL